MSSTVKPSKPEDEYFARVEAEKKRKRAEEYHRQLDEAERQKLKETHWMRCPKCGMELHEIVFRGVRMDKCFHCQGIFLDDGELEKITGGEYGFVKGLVSLFQS